MSTNELQHPGTSLTWTEGDSADFIAHGYLFIPQEARIRRMITSLLDACSPSIHIAELGCGAGRLLFDVASKNPDAEILAIDRSPMMLEASRERCLRYCDRIKFRCLDLADSGVFNSPIPFDAVYSSLTIHHLDEIQKVTLFQRIFDNLRQGGIFVYFDMFMPVTSFGLRLAAEEWPTEVNSQGEALGVPEAVARFNELGWNYYADPAGDPCDKPSRIPDVSSWLGAIGFRDIDLVWMSAGHALLAARK